MPTAADLDDPLGFKPQDVDADFDAALSELLEDGSDGSDDSDYSDT
jgi:hypothetical protein